MKLFQHHKNTKGFTLVEVIVALAILGIMAASFLTIFSSSFSTIFSMGRRTQAMNEDAQYIMELAHENLGDTIDKYSSNPNVGIDQVPYEGMTLVTVTVNYDGDSGKTVTLSSLIP